MIGCFNCKVNEPVILAHAVYAWKLTKGNVLKGKIKISKEYLKILAVEHYRKLFYHLLAEEWATAKEVLTQP